MYLASYNIDSRFYDCDPNQTWTAVNNSSDIIATKQDFAVLEQKIKELQKKIDNLTGPCYCESLL